MDQLNARVCEILLSPIAAKGLEFDFSLMHQAGTLLSKALNITRMRN
ncbi:MAG: hypothetical protein ACYTEX_25330 [Planctomycetota bacterium]